MPSAVEFIMVDADKIHNAIQSVLETLADKLCHCGYVLPSMTAINPVVHDTNCNYRIAITQFSVISGEIIQEENDRLSRNTMVQDANE